MHLITFSAPIEMQYSPRYFLNRLPVFCFKSRVQQVFAFPALLVDVLNVAERCHCHIVHGFGVDPVTDVRESTKLHQGFCVARADQSGGFGVEAEQVDLILWAGLDDVGGAVDIVFEASVEGGIAGAV